MSEFDVSLIYSHTQNLVLDAYIADGTQGIEKLVNDLSVEAEAARVLKQASDDMEHEDISDIVRIQNLPELLDIVNFVDDLSDDSELADRRLAIATKLFHAAQNCDWDFFYGLNPES